MKIKKILVPIDFSPGSLNALRYAVSFAKSDGAGIFLLHVTDPSLLEYELHGNLTPSHMFELLRKEEFMQGIKITEILSNGKVPDVILNESKSNDIDLVVMGTLGAGTNIRKLIGTNTIKVTGKSECPVLVVPSEATYVPIRKVILAIDLEKRSDKIVEEIINLIKGQKSSVLLVYVGSDNAGGAQKELMALTEEMKLKTGYDKIVSKRIDSSDFPMSLESFALNIEADILVMITHHRGVFESIFDPSQTKLYAYHTSIPLLVVSHQKVSVYFL